MKTMKKVLAIVLTAIMLFSCVSVSASAASADRYSVLVLDVSGSMGGSALTHLKKAAKGFCDEVLSGLSSRNQIAIVAFESDSKVVCDFTNNLNTLNTAIDGLYSGGGTDLTAGLQDAYNLLNGVSDSAIKNVLVMCDGEPDSASSAYSVVDKMPLHWNIYGLYFCQNYDSTTAWNVMQRIGRTDSYRVENADDLYYYFAEIGGDAAKYNDVNKTIVRVACPVDVSVTLNGVTLDKNNTKTFFGEFSFEDANKEVKILELAYRDDYVITIRGTGDGTMDYSVKFLSNDSEVFSLTYPTVEITGKTRIETGLNVNSAVQLNVDKDGDGVVDEKVSANFSTESFLYQLKVFFRNFFEIFLQVVKAILAAAVA